VTGTFGRIVTAFILAGISAGCDHRAVEKPVAKETPPAAQGKEDTPAPPSPPPQGAGFECAVLVRGSSGDPLTSVHVDFLLEGGSRVAGRVTDERGVARFRVPAGNYTVRISDHRRSVLAEVGYEVSGNTPAPIEVVIGRKDRP